VEEIGLTLSPQEGRDGAQPPCRAPKQESGLLDCTAQEIMGLAVSRYTLWHSRCRYAFRSWRAYGPL